MPPLEGDVSAELSSKVDSPKHSTFRPVAPTSKPTAVSTASPASPTPISMPAGSQIERLVQRRGSDTSEGGADVFPTMVLHHRPLDGVSSPGKSLARRLTPLMLPESESPNSLRSLDSAEILGTGVGGGSAREGPKQLKGSPSSPVGSGRTFSPTNPSRGGKSEAGGGARAGGLKGHIFPRDSRSEQGVSEYCFQGSGGVGQHLQQQRHPLFQQIPAHLQPDPLSEDARSTYVSSLPGNSSRSILSSRSVGSSSSGSASGSGTGSTSTSTASSPSSSHVLALQGVSAGSRLVSASVRGGAHGGVLPSPVGSPSTFSGGSSRTDISTGRASDSSNLGRSPDESVQAGTVDVGTPWMGSRRASGGFAEAGSPMSSSRNLSRRGAPLSPISSSPGSPAPALSHLGHSPSSAMGISSSVAGKSPPNQERYIGGIEEPVGGFSRQFGSRKQKQYPQRRIINRSASEDVSNSPSLSSVGEYDCRSFVT